MLVKSEQFKKVCRTIKQAVDSKGPELYNDTLCLVAEKSTLRLSVTDGEYYVTVYFPLAAEEQFKATVEAKKFLDLVSQILSEDIELTTSNNYLAIKAANGNYKLPLIYNNGSLLEIPAEINMTNVTTEMVVGEDILQSIATYNSRELDRGREYLKKTASADRLEKYYIDQAGAVTCTIGACINSFTLPEPLSIYVPDKVVRLFKLFKGEGNLNLTLSQEPLFGNHIQTILGIGNEDIKLTVNLGDLSTVKPLPIAAVRDLALKAHNFTAVLNRNYLLGAVKRLALVSSSNVIKLAFTAKTLTLSDMTGDNVETISITGGSSGDYNACVDLKILSLVLDTAEEDFVSLSFGDNTSISIHKQSVVDVIPECVE